MKRHGKAIRYNNLIPFDEMSPERHCELSARGGRASGESRRRKAEFQAVAQEMMMRYYFIDSLEEDIQAFRRWKKRHDKAKTNRERTPEK